jgi:regulator of protease activity HflC (stomatin/prohibitin superfamily)
MDLYKKITILIVVIVIVCVVVWLVASSYQAVPTGYEGVLLVYGKPSGLLDPGQHILSPVGQSIALVNVQILNLSAIESASTNDLQEVTTEITINYQYDAAHADYIYTNFAGDATGIIFPSLEDALKAATAQYQASELITRREDAKTTIQTILAQKLQPFHINVIAVSITNFNFSDQFQAAIDAKVTAEQNALGALNNLTVVQYQSQQQVIQAEAAANATVTTATANAAKTIITANATAQSIELINEQLQRSPQYLQYLALLQWDGKLPIYWAGNSTFPLITLPTP